MNARGSSAPCYHALVSTSRPARSLATSQDLIARSGPPAEIIGGELVEKATPSPEHGSAQFALSGQLFSPFGSSRGSGGPGGWWLMTEVEVEFATHETYRPDVVGWRRDRVQDRPRGTPVRIRPDWICEILSPTNSGNDRVIKLNAYHQFEVPHYWILDPTEETLSAFRWTQDGYLLVVAAGNDQRVRVEPFAAIEIEVGEIFGRESPEL